MKVKKLKPLIAKALKEYMKHVSSEDTNRTMRDWNVIRAKLTPIKWGR